MMRAAYRPTGWLSIGLGLSLLVTASSLQNVASAQEASAEPKAAKSSRAKASSRVAPRAEKPTPAPVPAAPTAFPGGPGATVSLTLADAVFVGLRKNTGIRSAYLERVAQIFDLKVAEDIFTPRAAITAGATRLRQGDRTSDVFQVTPTITALTPIGTQFNFAWDLSGVNAEDGTTRSRTLSANFAQPLLKGAGLEVNMASVKAARLAESNNRLALRATVSQTITDIVSAYRTLLSSQESLRLSQDAVVRAQALIEVNESLIQSGRMARVEIVQAQADLENQRLNVLQNENQVDTARLSLAVLLDLDLDTKIVLRDRLTVNKATIAAGDVLKIALRARPDYLIQVNNLELARLGVVVADNQRLWDLSIVGSTTIARTTQTSLNLPPVATKIEDKSIGVRLTAPLNDLAPQGNYIRATTSYKTTEIGVQVARRTVEQQIRQSYVAIDLSWRQVESARRVVKLASDAVDIEKQKLAVGRSSNFQVQSLEANFRAARLQVLSAEIAYVNSLTLFDLQLGTTLDTWRVSLRDDEANAPSVR